jgi:hypothetical protein
MKALTIIQPWASLIAAGAKTIETRSWSTRYRGPLAIHAASGRPTSAYFDAQRDLARRHMGVEADQLPSGQVVAVCMLFRCLPIDDPSVRQLLARRPPERPLGDYSPNRWAWVLSDIHRLDAPIPATGHQRLWKWTPPDGLLLTWTTHHG